MAVSENIGFLVNGTYNIIDQCKNISGGEFFSTTNILCIYCLATEYSRTMKKSFCSAIFKKT